MGCYSFSEIDQINDITQNDFENHDIKVTLFSGKVYNSKTYKHTNNIGYSDFIIGKGLVISPKLSWHSSFEGKIYRSEIDSQLIDGGILNLWLKDANHISMKKGDYFIFTPDMKNGVWVFEKSYKIFIDVDDIKSLEIESLNIFATTACILSITAVVFGVIAGIGLSNSLKDI